jgi:hypothetical protein
MHVYILKYGHLTLTLRQGEVRRVIATTSSTSQNRTVLYLSAPLQHTHYSGTQQTFGTRKMTMRAKVGMLSRNIIITGEGQGEELSYKQWNAPGPFKNDNQVCIGYAHLPEYVCLSV